MSITGYDEFQIALLPGIGSSRGRKLLDRFGSFRALRHADKRAILEVRGISHRTAAEVLATLRNPDKLREMHELYLMNMNICEETGIRFVCFNHPDYPEVLKSIYDPPLYLFVEGTLEACDEHAVAVVGTRNPTIYGRQAAERITRGLTENRLTVISGLALGIDTLAHTTALENGGRTIAVLGSGLRNIYPQRNRTLAGRIAENGCFLSELPLTAKPDAMNFPRRNRIISALSKAVILVESEEKGGGMITAEIALDQNREIFAVPGSIFSSKSGGPLLLLKKNLAHLMTDAEDLFDELPTLKPPVDAPRRSKAIQLTLEEQLLVDALDYEPRHIDDVLEATDFSPADLLVHLLDLEFKGAVRQLPGKHFVLCA